MIQIDNTDTPIEVEANMVDKAMMRAFGCKEVDTVHCDMFSIAEIKEIAGYLLVYCNAHRSQEEE